MTTPVTSAWSTAGEDDDGDNVDVVVDAIEPHKSPSCIRYYGRPPWINAARNLLTPLAAGPIPHSLSEFFEPLPTWQIDWSPPYLSYITAYGGILTNTDVWESWFTRWFVHLPSGIAVDASPLVEELGAWDHPGIRERVERFVENLSAAYVSTDERLTVGEFLPAPSVWSI